MLEHHRRPEIPPDCEDFFRNLMQSCWKHIPRDRPSFKEIVSMLEEEIERIKGEIDRIKEGRDRVAGGGIDPTHQVLML